MSRNINYNNFDASSIEELELDGAIDVCKFQPRKKKKRFDDGTASTKTGRKKEKVQRGGKDELLEIGEED